MFGYFAIRTGSDRFELSALYDFETKEYAMCCLSNDFTQSPHGDFHWDGEEWLFDIFLPFLKTLTIVGAKKELENFLEDDAIHIKVEDVEELIEILEKGLELGFYKKNFDVR